MTARHQSCYLAVSSARERGFFSSDFRRTPTIMNAALLAPSGPDIVGIVISEGTRVEIPPRFRAYLWEAPPESEPDTSTRAA